MIKNKRGISLIVLIITIIVMIILASVIVMSFSNSNPVGRAKEARFKSDLSGFKDEFLATCSDKGMSDEDFVKEDINIDSGNYTTIKEYIPDITEQYAKKLLIKNGNLLYIGDDTIDSFEANYNKDEEGWAKEIGIKAPYGDVGDANGDGEITKNDSSAIGDVANNGITIKDDSSRTLKACDVNGDNLINIDDVTYLNSKYGWTD